MRRRVRREERGSGTIIQTDVEAVMEMWVTKVTVMTTKID
jgi:hypothetical protein